VAAPNLLRLQHNEVTLLLPPPLLLLLLPQSLLLLSPQLADVF
jgi:hypothetical protein